MEWYLPIIWAGLIATAVALYVILDGFDLGMGILFPTTREEARRDEMMNSVAPFWDGNETWVWCWGAAACGSPSPTPMRSSCRRSTCPSS